MQLELKGRISLGEEVARERRKTDGGRTPGADPHIRTNLRWSRARKANKRGETPSR